jgi:hypothetical protein
MDIITSEELIELINTFMKLRVFGRRPYPNETWLKAASLMDRFSLEEICEAISVHPHYFQQKMRKLGINLEEKRLNAVSHKFPATGTSGKAVDFLRQKMIINVGKI